PVLLQRFQEADHRLLGVLDRGFVRLPPRVASRQRREVREVTVVVMLYFKRVCQRLFFHTPSVYHSSCDEHLPQALWPGRSPLHVMQEIMAIRDILKTHRTREDGASLVLGLMIGLSPWFYDEPAVPAVLLNSGLTGPVVLALAQLELV